MDIIIQGVLGTLIWAFVAVCIVICCIRSKAAADERRRLGPGSQHRRPGPARVVVGEPRQLVYFSYPADTEDGRGTVGASVVVCAICLEALVGGAECSEVPACRHVFHRGCLALWIESKGTCPLCREHVVPGPGPEPPSAADNMV
ncbi:RING-H2 finger protein ATL39-like [Aegilops tauschii subsp. strangulata]|uniref:RING-H2 finger protein ATL39-like n=1 Tax=Aegilops tauschii subsp. strangulata TaxID=200361 RepID=UPI00098B3784|nr:RING-H2 finger protein ATL39-like [Aegilops tauschii subsp. strangulata]